MRQAAVGARAKLKGATNTSEGEDGGGRMKLRSRSAKANKETKTTKPTSRAKHPTSKPKPSPKTQKATTAKPARGRPKGKSGAKDAKGKGKTRPLESVLDLSDDTREVSLAGIRDESEDTDFFFRGTKRSVEDVWSISNVWRDTRYKRRTCMSYDLFVGCERPVVSGEVARLKE